MSFSIKQSVNQLTNIENIYFKEEGFIVCLNYKHANNKYLKHFYIVFLFLKNYIIFFTDNSIFYIISRKTHYMVKLKSNTVKCSQMITVKCK